MWETARNLWSNWGTSYFWASSLAAAIAGVLIWWGIGLVAYLSGPKSNAQAQPQPTPVVQQSMGNVSGGSTVNQAGGNITINQGVSEETLQAAIRDKGLAMHRELSAKYPAGYVILGMANGKIIKDIKLTKLSIETDWDQWEISLTGPPFPAAGNGEAITVIIPAMRVVHLGTRAVTNFQNVADVISRPRVGRSYQSSYVPGMSYEMLDRDNGVFALGFKNEGQ
jgi:hypothetical protein